MAAGNNLRRLKRLLEETEGDVREAVRRFTGLPLSGVAERLGIRRSDLNFMLAQERRYLHDRRRLEAEFDLPPYSLDTILDTEE
jgi:hypothetical protein